MCCGRRRGGRWGWGLTMGMQVRCRRWGRRRSVLGTPPNMFVGTPLTMAATGVSLNFAAKGNDGSRGMTTESFALSLDHSKCCPGMERLCQHAAEAKIIVKHSFAAKARSHNWIHIALITSVASMDRCRRYQFCNHWETLSRVYDRLNFAFDRELDAI